MVKCKVYRGRLLFVRIDASEEDDSLGRLVNDDNISPNTNMKKLVIGNEPRLCLFATRHINPGDEITYNYGTMDYPWRQKRVCLIYTLMLCTLVKKAEQLYSARSNSNITAAALMHAIDLLLGCCRR